MSKLNNSTDFTRAQHWHRATDSIIQTVGSGMHLSFFLLNSSGDGY